MTQADRVLKAARSYRGTSQAEWLADVTPDGGPRITRVAARIQELEEQGHVFEIIGRRSKCVVYRLADVERTVSADSRPVTPAASAGEQRLVTQPTSAEGSRKAPGGQDEPGLIPRGSAGGSLDAGTLFGTPVESGPTAHWKDAA